MIFLIYLVLAALVTVLSVKASNYVDLIDKKTSLSGAFIGGVMLSAVTSLPELFTSLSSTVLLDTPSLCLGNILGSDLFNVAALSVVALCFLRPFRKGEHSRKHVLVMLPVLGCYLALYLNYIGILRFEILTISITSIILMVLYILSIKFLSDEGGEPDDEADGSALTLRQVVIRFIFASIGIVIFSILVTYVTDDIADLLGLGKGMAGALLLGVATSLPELSSTITLFRIGNYNIAIGNIVGSNIFNFAILAIVDVPYLGSGLYTFNEAGTIALLYFGVISMLVLTAMLWKKNRLTTLLCPLLCVASYIGFLLLG